MESEDIQGSILRGSFFFFFTLLRHLCEFMTPSGQNLGNELLKGEEVATA